MGLEDNTLLCGTESRPALSGMSFGAEGPADFFPVLSSNLFSNTLIHLFVYSARRILWTEKHPNQCILISAEVNIYLLELQLSLKLVPMQEDLCLNSCQAT